MHSDTKKYNEAQTPNDREICQILSAQIDHDLPEAQNKIWHGHPVWFLEGNPIVGYSKLKEKTVSACSSGAVSPLARRASRRKEPSKPPKGGTLRPIKLTQSTCAVGWPRPGIFSGTIRTWPGKVAWSG